MLLSHDGCGADDIMNAFNCRNFTPGAPLCCSPTSIPHRSITPSTKDIKDAKASASKKRLCDKPKPGEAFAFLSHPASFATEMVEFILLLNPLSPRLSDLSQRWGLLHGIDRSAIVESYPIPAFPVFSPIPYGPRYVLGGIPVEQLSVGLYPYDEESAMYWLHDYGEFASEQASTLAVPDGWDEGLHLSDVAGQVAQMIRNLGIETHIVNQDWAAILGGFEAGVVDLAIVPLSIESALSFFEFYYSIPPFVSHEDSYANIHERFEYGLSAAETDILRAEAWQTAQKLILIFALVYPILGFFR